MYSLYCCTHSILVVSVFYLACCFYNLVKILQLTVHSINFTTEMQTKYCESPERKCKTFPSGIRLQASRENSVPQGQRGLFPVKNGQKSHAKAPDSGRRAPSRKQKAGASGRTDGGKSDDVMWSSVGKHLMWQAKGFQFRSASRGTQKGFLSRWMA